MNSMAVATKPRNPRQSVTLPASLAKEVRRIARERRLTMSRALVVLAEKGVEAERDAKASLRAAHHQFLVESEPAKKDRADKNLIRAIFGKDALAEDPVR
jgi:hypothetical protein